MGVESRFNTALIPLQTYIEEANKSRATFGVTDLYSTGNKGLDEYLGKGFGRRENGYEMILIYGGSGEGKSLTALNFMLDPIFKGVNTGLMILEDDPVDVLNRMRVMTDGKIDECDNVFFVDPQNSGYTLEQAMNTIEQWFEICDVIFLDHLEYLFAGAVGESEHAQFQRQAAWMRHLNLLMKRNGKTIVMIQHTNKSEGQGMQKIKGSGAFAQTCTKVIEISRTENNTWLIDLQKTRFTPYRSSPYEVGINKFRIKDL